MMMTCREGDWFATPLSDRDYAVGLIARGNPPCVPRGDFFGPQRRDIPTLDEVASLRPSDAVLVRKWGILGSSKRSDRYWVDLIAGT
jgi:hypothetical protein